MAEFALTGDQLAQVLESVTDVFIGRGGLPDVQDGLVANLRDALWRAPKMRFNVTGTEKITYPVRGRGQRVVPQGYKGDEIVSFTRAGGFSKAEAKIYDEHAGLEFVETELRRYGIVITDVPSRPSTLNARRASEILVDAVRDAYNQFMEGLAEDEQVLFWGDGTADPKRPPGVLYWLGDDNTTPMLVSGIDQGANRWWRHTVTLGVAANASNASSGVLIEAFEKFWRDMLLATGNKYRPQYFFCGSDFYDQLRREVHARGQFTTTGWSAGADVSTGTLRFHNIPFVIEPHLDDIGRSKYCYALRLGEDGIQIALYEGRNWRRRSAVRPHDRYVAYVPMTRTWTVVCRRRAGMGVISIA